MATSTTSPLLAGTFGDCCFVASVKHEGDPTGRIETIADFQTYIADPPASSTTSTGPKKVVLFFADVYGPFVNTTKLLQDYYASNGKRISDSILEFLGRSDSYASSQASMSWVSTISSERRSTSSKVHLGLTGPNGH